MNIMKNVMRTWNANYLTVPYYLNTYDAIQSLAASLGDIDHCEVLMRAGSEIDLR